MELLRDLVENGIDDDRRTPSVTSLIQVSGLSRGARAATELGFSHQEIAEVVGLSRSAITKRLADVPRSEAASRIRRSH